MTKEQMAARITQLEDRISEQVKVILAEDLKYNELKDREAKLIANIEALAKQSDQLYAALKLQDDVEKASHWGPEAAKNERNALRGAKRARVKALSEYRNFKQEAGK